MGKIRKVIEEEKKMKKVKAVLLIGSFLVILTSTGQAQLQFIEHTIEDNFNGANSVYAIDMDGDNDVDVLGAAFEEDNIAWWENDGNQNFSEHIIDDWLGGAYDVYAIDLDSDGDVDVLGAAYGNDDIAWYENDGAQEFTEHTIDRSFAEAVAVYAIDLDGDEDVDVLGAAREDDDIAWWENDGDQNFTEHTIDDECDGIQSVYAVDIDSDEDVDVLGAATLVDSIIWWENDGNQNFTGNVISDDFYYAYDVYAIDLDGDGDVDILGAAYGADDIIWWENDGNNNFIEHTIADNFDGARSVFAVDLDCDGDVDVLGAASQADEIVWWENDGAENFTQHSIVTEFDYAKSVYASDLDGDEDIDVLGAAREDDDIIWWENLGTESEEFELVSPEDSGIVQNDTVTIIWTASANPDGFEYVIEWSLFEEFLQDSTARETTTDTFFVLTDILILFVTTGELDELPDDISIYWRVRAVGEGGAITWANDDDEGWSFDIEIPDPPEPFGLISPANGSNIQQSGTMVTWSETTDPDPNNIPSYEVWLDTLDDQTTSWQVGDRVDYTQRYISNLQANQDYYWTVYATDSNTDGTWARDTFYFNTDQDVLPDEYIVERPVEYSITSIHPNPFNSTLTIVIGLPESSLLIVRIFNIIGEEVALLADGSFMGGYHKFGFEGDKLSSGIYFVRAEVPGKMIEMRKIVLVR